MSKLSQKIAEDVATALATGTVPRKLVKKTRAQLIDDKTKKEKRAKRKVTKKSRQQNRRRKR